MTSSPDARKWLFAALAAAPIPFVAAILGEYLAVHPWGTDLVLVLVVTSLGVPALAGFGLGLMAAVISRTARRKALVITGISAGCIALLMAGIAVGWRIRRAAFEELAARSAPLVAAINAYQAKYGQPPEKLQNLVPEFLPTVPRTQMGAYPSYEYVSGESAQPWDNNPWALYVPCGHGFNFDQFIYLPLQNYPPHGYGGSLERIGDWAYVHE